VNRIELRSAGKTYSLPCRFWRRARHRGFPPVRHAKSFEDACEIVGAPTMAQYERSRDGPWVLAYLQFTWRLSEQALKAVVHIQLLEEDRHQRRRPTEHGGRGDRRTNGPRSNIPAPAFCRCLCRSGATSVLACVRGGTGARRRRRAYGRFCLGRLSTRGHGRSWDWRHSAASDCFTASAMLHRLALHEFAGLFLATRWRSEQVSGMRYPERNQVGRGADA
jgi:hypothetical protein